jgi:rare lipoprotein A
MIRIIPSSAVLFLILALLFPGDPAFGMGPKRYQSGEVEHGKASWYGNADGRRTASGERFDENEFTAAHRHLPFGTIVRVTNEKNGRSVKVRINDRGPWTGGRIIDVSSAAADVLQMKRYGIVPVEIEILELGSPGRHLAGP